MIKEKNLQKIEYRDEKYYDIRYRLNKYKWLRFFISVGDRGIGKTTSTKMEVVYNAKNSWYKYKDENKVEKFVWCRRTRKLIEAGLRDWGKRFDDVECNGSGIFLIERGMRVKDGIETPYKRVLCQIGYWVDLWNPETAKSREWDDVKYFVYEEFLSETKQYLTSEITKFNSVINSIGRDRDNFYIFLIANAVDKDSPYFNSFGITSEDFPERNEILLIPQRKMLVEYAGMSDYVKERQINSTIGLIQRGSEYQKFASGETWMYDSGVNVKHHVEGIKEHLCNVVVFGQKYEVLKVNKHRLWIKEGYNPQGKTYYATNEDAISNNEYFINFNWFLYMLHEKLASFRAYFQSVEIKENFVKLLTKLK